ncbi:hypothetical protein RCL1_007873 [Eukaryota sp. TZLM3-RCL]
MVSHPHTAEHIAETLKLLLHDFGILEKIVAITTDNGKNVTKAVDILSAEFPRIQSVRCMGHVLNLAVQEGLDIVADVISKTRELAKLLHRSSKQRELFILIHNQLNLSKEDNFNDTEDSGTEDERVYSKEEEKDINSTFNGPSLPLDVITRWNSTFKMLSAYKQLEATIAYFLKKENLQHFILNDTEEKAVDKYIKVLMPFDSATKILSGDKYPTLGLVIAATVHCYSALLVEHSNDEEDIIVTAIEKMKEKMLEYVPFMYNYTSFKGTLLDPRFKDGVHPSLMNKSDYKDKLKSELQTVKPHNVGGKTLATPCHFFPTRTDESDHNNELEVYLKERTASQHQDPLEWWKVNEERFPALSILAKETLIVQATSVPSERLFSKAGDIVSQKRCRLNPLNVRVLTCLKSWMHTFEGCLEQL